VNTAGTWKRKSRTKT